MNVADQIGKTNVIYHQANDNQKDEK